MQYTVEGSSTQSDLETKHAASLRLTQLIGEATTLTDLLEPALQECCTLFGVDHGSIFLLDIDAKVAHLAAQHPATDASVTRRALSDDQLLQQVCARKQLLLLPDAVQVAATEGASHFGQEEVQTALFLPLLARTRLVGILELVSLGQARVWTADELLLAQLLAGQLGGVIDSLQLMASTEQRDAEVSTLNDIAATVTSTLDPRHVYRLVVQKINEYFRVEAGSLWLIDRQTNELVSVMTLEAGEEKLVGVRVPPGQGLIGEALRVRKAVVVNDAQNDPRFYKKVSEDVGFVTKSALCVPMFVQGQEIGVIQLLNKIGTEFNTEDTDRLGAMSNTIAVAIYNAQLFQEIAEGRNRLQAILNSTEDAILSIDMAGVVVTANPMMEKLFGLPWRTLEGQSGHQILEQLEERTRVINETSASDTIELEILRPRSGFVRRIILPVHNSVGERIGQLIVFHDMTEERELARLRDDYTNMLVHDLRAPLTAIMNGIRMVERGFAGAINDQQRELLKIANNSSQDMVGMINTLLDISKMEAGEITLNREPCSVYDIVEQARDRVIASAQASDIEIKIDMPAGIPIIEADPDKLVRVLQNLLDNAIKFSPMHNLVQVRVRPFESKHQPGAIIWSVIDKGPGIPEAYRARIFEKFAQQPGQKVKGTGLGLTFAKLTTEAHGGYIWVESEEGEGSTFSFTTPYKAE